MRTASYLPSVAFAPPTGRSPRPQVIARLMRRRRRSWTHRLDIYTLHFFSLLAFGNNYSFFTSISGKDLSWKWIRYSIHGINIFFIDLHFFKPENKTFGGTHCAGPTIYFCLHLHPRYYSLSDLLFPTWLCYPIFHGSFLGSCLSLSLVCG